MAASSTIRPSRKCSTTIRSRSAGVTRPYHTPSGYTTTIGPPVQTPRQGVSPRFTRSGPKRSPSRSSRDASCAYSSRPRRSGEQKLPTQTSTWREYGSRNGSENFIVRIARDSGGVSICSDARQDYDWEPCTVHGRAANNCSSQAADSVHSWLLRLGMGLRILSSFLRRAWIRGIRVELAWALRQHASVRDDARTRLAERLHRRRAASGEVAHREVPAADRCRPLDGWADRAETRRRRTGASARTPVARAAARNQRHERTSAATTIALPAGHPPIAPDYSTIGGYERARAQSRAGRGARGDVRAIRLR